MLYQLFNHVDTFNKIDSVLYNEETFLCFIILSLYNVITLKYFAWAAVCLSSSHSNKVETEKMQCH